VKMGEQQGGMAAAAWDTLLQIYVLLRKDTVLAIRSWKLTSLQVLAPLCFVLVLLIIQVIPKASDDNVDPNPPAINIGGVPQCDPFDFDFCYSLMYAPAGLAEVDGIVQKLADGLGTTVVPYSDDVSQMPSGSVVACESAEQIIDFMWEYQNVTQAALLFYETQSPGDPVNVTQSVEYTLLYNATCLTPFVPLGTKCPNVYFELQRAVDIAILSEVTGIDVANITVARRTYPVVSWNVSAEDVVASYGVLFFYCGMMFSFVIIIYQLVYEKENKLKQGMLLMGMEPTAYWTSWFVFSSVINLIATLLMMATGYACMFTFFWETNFLVNFISFFLFGESMITLAFLVSSLIGTAKSAISVGMLLFIIGVLIQVLLTSPDFLAFCFYDGIIYSEIVYYVLIWYPPFNFAKCVSDVAQLSFDYGQIEGPGYTWRDLYTPLVTDYGTYLPPTVQSWYLLTLNLVVFAILTWYMENILPSATGTVQPPWFFLTKEYWGIPRRIKSSISSGTLQRRKEDPATIDPDVVKEDSAAMQIGHSGETGSDSAVAVVRLSKDYRKIPIIKSPWDFNAVDNVSFCIPESTLFCLLGHNGAGKTTTINMLTGLFPPTGGDAYIYGKSILTEKDSIRHMMGVCPQHDILWGEMTAREHLQLFALLKGVPRGDRDRVIAEKLESVRLTSVGNNRVSSYSGGMKRRLSVAISSIGEPRIIFMDEPVRSCHIACPTA